MHTFVQIFKEMEHILCPVKVSEKHIYSGRSLWTLMPYFILRMLPGQEDRGWSVPLSQFKLQPQVRCLRRSEAARSRSQGICYLKSGLARSISMHLH
jgi:hypothetical protein